MRGARGLVSWSLFAPEDSDLVVELGVESPAHSGLTVAIAIEATVPAA